MSNGDSRGLPLAWAGEARGTAKWPTGHRTVPTAKNDLAPDVPKAQVRNPGAGLSPPGRVWTEPWASAARLCHLHPGISTQEPDGPAAPTGGESQRAPLRRPPWPATPLPSRRPALPCHAKGDRSLIIQQGLC